MSASPRRAPARAIASAAALDAILIVLFALIGRQSHAEDSGILPALGTAWPFLAGAAIAWVLGAAWRAPAALRWTGPLVWLGAVVIGLPLRALTGGGIELGFVLVTAGVLALFLIGWRALALLVTHRRGRRA